MEHALRDLTFEEWIAHTFDHEAEGPQWYFDMDAPYWDGPDTTTVSYLTQLFQNPASTLEPYSDAQIDQGFWYLVSNGGGDYVRAIRGESVALTERLACIESMSQLFANLYATRCAPLLSHLDESGMNALNSSCYMWWDIAPLVPEPAQAGPSAVDNALLGVMESQLALDSPACQESGLHGLGHWYTGYPELVGRLIANYLEKHSDLRPELRSYAKSAQTGCVL